MLPAHVEANNAALIGQISVLIDNKNQALKQDLKKDLAEMIDVAVDTKHRESNPKRESVTRSPEDIDWTDF